MVCVARSQHFWVYSLPFQLHIQWEKDSYFLEAQVLVCLGYKPHWANLGCIFIPEPITVTKGFSTLARLRLHAEL